MPLSLPLALLLPTPETGESGPLLMSDHTQQVLNALIPKTTIHELSDLPKAGQGGDAPSNIGICTLVSSYPDSKLSARDGETPTMDEAIGETLSRLYVCLYRGAIAAYTVYRDAPRGDTGSRGCLFI